MNAIIIVLALVKACLGDVSHVLLEHSSTTTTIPPPPKPYSFQYAAGRYPGHVDRVHQEAGDGSGIVHGSYSFVDPKHKVRTVEYTADKNGFHPLLTNYEDTLAVPVDSEAVKLAKLKHYNLYTRIANSHAQGVPANVPVDTVSVTRARDKHLYLFEKIAEEHAAIAAQRKAKELENEAEQLDHEETIGHN